MDAAFATAGDLLTKRLAPLSLTFRTLAPTFYLAYKTAREIVDLGGPGEPTPPEPPVNP